MTIIRTKGRKRILFVGVIVLILMLAICGLLDWWGDEGVRDRTGYLASVGGTDAEYEAVDAFMTATFPPGMERKAVIEVLDRRFICTIRPIYEGRSDDGTYRIHERVAFPNRDCANEAEWRIKGGEPGCRGVEYDFWYLDDRLDSVTMVVS